MWQGNHFTGGRGHGRSHYKIGNRPTCILHATYIHFVTGYWHIFDEFSSHVVHPILILALQVVLLQRKSILKNLLKDLKL